MNGDTLIYDATQAQGWGHVTFITEPTMLLDLATDVDRVHDHCYHTQYTGYSTTTKLAANSDYRMQWRAYGNILGQNSKQLWTRRAAITMPRQQGKSLWGPHKNGPQK